MTKKVLFIAVLLVTSVINLNAEEGVGYSDVGTLSSISYGTTVIAHGLNFSLSYDFSTAQTWTVSMAEAIAERKGKAKIYLITNGNIEEYNSGFNDEDGEKIIIVDWLRDSQKPVFGFSEGAGDALAALLIKGAIEGKWTLNDLHFIGHSRGTIVSSEAIQRLGLYASVSNTPIDEDIHFTSLDAHPWDNRINDHIGDPLSAEDHDVNGSDINWGVVGWNNVEAADNYWHTGAGIDLNGLENIPGIPKKYNLTERNGKYTDMNHRGVHAWYHGTIDVEATNDGANDTPVVINDDTWYIDYPRETSGYSFNPSNIQSSNTRSFSEDPTFDRLMIFNGDFSKGYNIIDRVIQVSDIFSLASFIDLAALITGLTKGIPGWKYHGGDGDGHIGRYDNIALNPHLELDWNNTTLKHNYLYIPNNVAKIYFRYKVANASFNDRFKVYLGSEELLDESVGYFRTVYRWREIFIPTNMKGTAQTLEFVLDGNGIVTSELWIDDIGFSKRANFLASVFSDIGLKTRENIITNQEIIGMEIHAYDNSGNHTGPVGNNEWEEEIPGSQFFVYIDSLGQNRQSIILPKPQEGREYQITIKAIEELSSVSIELEDNYSANTSSSVAYERIELAPTGTVSATISNFINNISLVIDSDGDGTIDSTITPTNFNTNHLIYASTDGNGTISPSDTTFVASGTDAQYKIEPLTNYEIDDVKVNGQSHGAISEYTFSNVNSDHTIYASFKLVTGIEDEEQVPSEYELNQNYPNPFNPATNFSYALPKGSYVKLVIFDIKGKEVITLVDEYQQEGYYNINHVFSTLSSGVYIYKLTAGSFSDSKKMLFIK